MAQRWMEARMQLLRSHGGAYGGAKAGRFGDGADITHSSPGAKPDRSKYREPFKADPATVAKLQWLRDQAGLPNSKQVWKARKAAAALANGFKA